MNEFKKYQRTNIAEMREYYPGEDTSKISISPEDVKNGSPNIGDMIARNPDNHDDQWLVSREYFENNFVEKEGPEGKTLDNTSVEDAKEKVSDIKVFGNGNLWQLLCKASSQKQGWMKSTKAMQTPFGCAIQVTTQQKNPDGSYSIGEAVTFIPGVEIGLDPEGNPAIVESDVLVPEVDMED